MSFLKKLNPFRKSSSQVFSNQEVNLILNRNEVLQKALDKEFSTPAPNAEILDSGDYTDIRMPRIPFNPYLFYLMRYESVVLRTVCLKLKQEIFRETLKEGFEFEPVFEVKCVECGAEFKEHQTNCQYCNSNRLIPPDVKQKDLWNDFIKEVNQAEQTLLEVLQELEDDLNTDDNSYCVFIKEYMIAPNGEVYGKIQEVMRGDPILFKIVADINGRRGGRYFTCIKHRNFVTSAPGNCPTCSLRLFDVHYVETEAGGRDPVKYYIKGEVVHFSKYEPSRLYGLSPIFTLWILCRVLLLMDKYTENLYQKGRLKGILGVGSDNSEAVEKWWDQTQDRLRKDPHYLPLVAYDPGDTSKGRFEFIKLIDSLKEMEYAPAKEMLRKQIAAVYGVSPIFQSDFSAGSGLNNEGLQITVTDRAVEFGQSIYHNKLLNRLSESLYITHWKIKLKSSREIDEMAELQRFHQKVQTAREMLELGYDVKLENETFTFSGEAKPREELIPYGTGSTSFFDNIKPAESEAPNETPGVKICPPGQVSTIENPKCHPAEWEYNKEKKKEKNYLIVNCKESTFQQELKEAQTPNYKLFWTLDKVRSVGDPQKATELVFKTEKGIRGSFPIKGFGKETYKGKIQPVIYFHKNFTPGHITKFGNVPISLVKNGDMMAYFVCIFKKLGKDKERIPKNLKYKDWNDWLAKQDPEFKKKVAEAKKLCSNQKDPDFPVPPGFEKATQVRIFDMVRNADETGISGTGTVATGIIFSDGKVVLRWNSKTPSINHYDSFEDFENIHIKPHPSNDTKLIFYDLKEEDISKLLKSIESGRALDSKYNKIQNAFLKQLENTYQLFLFKKLKKIDVEDKKAIKKIVNETLKELQEELEKIGISNIFNAYKKGKNLVTLSEQKKELEKQIPIDWDKLPFSKSDIQVLRAILTDSPFWESFSNMTRAISDKLKEIITESYMAPTEARFKAVLRDVQIEYPAYSLNRQMQIVYGRIGKFNLGSTIEQMQRTVNAEVYRLERIARTETTAVTSKGREIAFTEQDPENNFKYDWFGVIDSRTSEQCKEIERKVKNEGRGKGVSLDRLKQIQKEVVDKYNIKNNTNWSYRDWVPHANCRRVLRRVG